MSGAGAPPLIEWLGTAEGGSDRLGGKAASLDRLARMGFRIPPGFCVTTDAFRRQLREVTEANVRVGAAAASDAPGESDLPTAIAGAPLMAELDAELNAAVGRLTAEAPRSSRAFAEPAFAVRSSAIGEDGSAASYAGLHETELGVAPADVDAAIRRCWASLWSPQALAYRRFRGLDLDGAAMAVVVQSLVPADAAAVAFTRHPVTGRDDQLVITAVRGLGDAMVSGTVTPDTIVIEKASLAVTEFTPGDGPRALDDEATRELATLCLRVETGFGRAVDIEAAMTGNTWFLLQARPITTH